MNPSSPSRPGVADLPRSVLISGIGAIVLFVSVFMHWYTAKVTGLPAALGAQASKSFSGWEATDVARLVALLAIVAIAAWVIELFVPDVSLPAPAWMIAGGAGALSTLF